MQKLSLGFHLPLLEPLSGKGWRRSHQRGGTGKGQIVGVFDSGVELGHPDLAGQFQYICSMGHCNGQGGSHDDGQPGLDRMDYQSPLEDTDGHGTAVNGVIAARRNGVGTFGIAYEAKIASYGNTAPVPWDEGCGLYEDCNNIEHAWGSVFDQQIARGVDWMRSLNVQIINNSWTRTGPWKQDSGLTANQVSNIMPLSIPAYQQFVNAGGVVVFANANAGPENHPDTEAVLPQYFPKLRPGWLAVGALGHDELIAHFSQRCGIAADWCITAPGEVITTELGGDWRATGGTSFSAPYVAAGLAALKSLFPNLSYHQIRTRILATADKTGPYADTQLYGQGRLNLEAASRPVGGTNFALGTQASGPVLSTSGAAMRLPDSFIRRHISGKNLLVLDSFQRAPFSVHLDSFITRRRAYLVFSDLTISDQPISTPVPADQRSAETLNKIVAFREDSGLLWGQASRSHDVAFGQGRDVITDLAGLSGPRLPVTTYQLSDQALGLTMGGEGWQMLAATNTSTVPHYGYGLKAGAPDITFAAGFTSLSEGQMQNRSIFALALATGLDRPSGWEGGGAFRLDGQSMELGWGQGLYQDERTGLEMTNRLTYLMLASGPLMQFDDAAVLATGLDATHWIIPELLQSSVRLSREAPLSAGYGHLHLATGVSPDGQLTYTKTRFSTTALMRFDSISLGIRYTPPKAGIIGVSITGLKDGFGQTEALAGVHFTVKF